MITSEQQMISALDAELLRFASNGWDSGIARSPFEAGEWLIAFEELYWAVLNPDHPANVSKETKLLKDYFEHHGVDLSEIERQF